MVTGSWVHGRILSNFSIESPSNSGNIEGGRKQKHEEETGDTPEDFERQFLYLEIRKMLKPKTVWYPAAFWTPPEKNSQKS